MLRYSARVQVRCHFLFLSRAPLPMDQRFDSLTASLFPARSVTPQEAFQLRLLIGGALLGLGVSIISVGVSLANSWAGAAAIVGSFGMGCCAVLAATRAGAPMKIVQRGALLLLGGFLVAESLQTAELDWAQFKWLALLPMISSLMQDTSLGRGAPPRTSGGIWIGAGLALLLGALIVVANRVGWNAGVIVPPVPAGRIAYDSAVDYALFLISVVGLMSIHSLARRKQEEEVRMLRSLLSICAWCRRIHDGEEGWMVIERYMTKHEVARLTHGICPECAEKVQREIS